MFSNTNTDLLPWSVLPIPHLRGATVEWVGSDGKMLISKRNNLFSSFDEGRTLTSVASLPESMWKSWAARVRPIQRALREMCYNVIDLGNDCLFVTFGKAIFVIRSGRVVRISGLTQATRVLRGACAVGEDGAVYFGEYCSNEDRREVHVYRWHPADDRLEVVHTFTAGSVRHVHGVYWNPADGSLWCLTGDREHECSILRTQDGFGTIAVVGKGDETWRAVSIQFMGDSAFYGMDAEFVPNRVFRLDTRTGRRDDLGEVNGPVYYSVRIGTDVVFGVTAERCPSQLDGCAALWYLDGAMGLQRIASWSKDALPHALFMPGTIHMSRTDPTAQGFWIHGVGLQRADNLSFRVARKQ